MKPVREEQMLLVIAREDPIEAAELPRIETVACRLPLNWADGQDEGMSIGAPNWTCVRHCKVRRLECDQAESGCGGSRAAHRREVGTISPKPFPRDERSISLEEG